MHGGRMDVWMVSLPFLGSRVRGMEREVWVWWTFFPRFLELEGR